MFTHLKETGIGYCNHWWRAMKCSLALCAHAFIPSFFESYASNELMEENDVIAYIDLGDQLSQDVEHLKGLKGKKHV